MRAKKRKLVSKWFSVKWFAGFNSKVFFSRSISTIPDSHKIRSQCNLGIAVYSWLSVQYRSTPWTVHHGVDSDKTSQSSASSSISHFKLQWLPACWIVPYNIKLHPFHWESDLYFNSQGNSWVSIITRTRSTKLQVSAHYYRIRLVVFLIQHMLLMITPGPPPY